ncbi:MAG: hypothetical protein JXA14_10180 [Anaerolineae bacterium]|nr:hypothetical protein [Anaerolineae bacterium]
MYEVIDTFPAFLNCWAQVGGRSLDEQIERWAEYLTPWPELLTMQVDDYGSQELDWREIARAKILPYLGERLPAMQNAHDNLLRILAPVYDRALETLHFDNDIVFVLYVGIGCGAGWATSYGGVPAILFGLENIAECGWSSAVTLTGLAAHEIGHLAHHHWRAQAGQPIGRGPWWQLYEEGFAGQCESLILQAGTLHRAGQHDSEGWLNWCERHLGWLAAEFLRTVDAGKPVTPFFGSWFNVAGKNQTGYYLGYQAIKELCQDRSLKDVALLEDVEECVRPIVKKMALLSKQ